MAVPKQKTKATNAKKTTGGGGAGGAGNTDQSAALVAASPTAMKSSARKNIPIIYKECIKNGVKDPGQIAYVIATAEHESHLGKMMMERQWVKDEAANNKYFTERYGSRKDLGNIEPADGPRFTGRGFCQITGRVNYTYWSKKLGIDLINNPDLAAKDISVAARILVVGMRDGTFTKRHKLADHIGGGKRDFDNARRIINAVEDKKNPKNHAEKQKAMKAISAAANRYYNALVG
ncbi:MAG: hypothetical protein KDK36_13920 [Leptospiraceae bacterium]|nr:hypothetical protein [Leptospiraceae bacterium]